MSSGIWATINGVRSPRAASESGSRKGMRASDCGDGVRRGEDAVAGIGDGRVGGVGSRRAVGAVAEQARSAWPRIAGKGRQQRRGGLLATEVAQRVGGVTRPLRIVEERDQHRQGFGAARPAQRANAGLHPPLRRGVVLVFDFGPAADGPLDAFNQVIASAQGPRRTHTALHLAMPVGRHQFQHVGGQVAFGQGLAPRPPHLHGLQALGAAGEGVERVFHAGDVGQGHPGALPHVPIGVVEPLDQRHERPAAPAPPERQRGIAPHVGVGVAERVDQGRFGRIVPHIAQRFGRTGAGRRVVRPQGLDLRLPQPRVGVGGSTGLGPEGHCTPARQRTQDAGHERVKETCFHLDSPRCLAVGG